MRLICPNCDAQYEVPTEVIPTDGRDVQCSNCGQTWFQHHPDHMPEAPEDADTADVPTEHHAPAPDEEHVEIDTDAQRRTLDPAVADILRQEAEHEAQVRANEGEHLESQPELGPELGPELSAEHAPQSHDAYEDEDDASKRARQARERMARMRGQTPEADAATATAATAAIGSRRDLLPDIEEINSTLRSTGDRQIAGDDRSAMAPVRARAKRGFRRGFFGIILIAAVLGALYVFAPTIAKTVPQVDPTLSRYVSTIDQGRNWLDGQITSLLKWLDETAAAQQVPKQNATTAPQDQ